MRDLQNFSEAIGRLPDPVFLARAVQRRGTVIYLHTTDPSASGRLARGAAVELRRDGQMAECAVVVHRHSGLQRQTSIEGFVGSLGVGAIIHDPTGLVRRSEALVGCAARLRQRLGRRLTGLYFNAERRALFVILDRSMFANDPEKLLAGRVAAMGEVTSLVADWRRTDAADFDIAVRIGFELPADVTLIPVDRRSASRRLRRRLFQQWRRPGIVAAFASLLGLGAASQAAAADLPRVQIPAALPAKLQQPAVARSNIDILLAGAWLNGNGFSSNRWSAIGAKVAVPLGGQWGAQVDASVGTQRYWGIGGHLFWRDPSVGLIGALATAESMNGAQLNRVAVEAEAYHDAVTFRGAIGAQSGIASGLFGALDVTFYGSPDFKFSLGGEFSSGRSVGRVRAEWQPTDLSQLAGLSIFADGEIGTGGYSKVLAGVSFHFGSQGVTLIDRDRKYDPEFALWDNTTVPQPAGYVAPPKV